MELFRKKEKEYTLREAMKLLQKDEYTTYMPIAINPANPNTKYWLRNEPQTMINATAKNIIKQNVNNNFVNKREKFANEISSNGEFRKIVNDINVSHSDKPGRVIRYEDTYQRGL